MNDFKLDTLTNTQQLYFDLIESTDDNYLIHGPGGVGKSVLTNALRENGQKPWLCAAPTGLAALNVNGKTLHSIFMIPVSSGIIPADYNRFTNNPNVVAYITHAVKYLIIDEISMVRADILDYIDRTLRYFKKVNKPFGGIQVVAVGDFFQLPPVVVGNDKQALLDGGWRSEFAFDAHCFENFKPLILDEVLRQKGGDGFIEILHSGRTGHVDAKQLARLNKRVEPCTDFRVRLCGTNKLAEQTNLAKLAAIKEAPHEFHANNFGTWPQFPAETVLQLKVGAQVLVKLNGADVPPGKMRSIKGSKVVNGSLGIVREFREASDDLRASVMVELCDGSVVPIYIGRWEQKVREKINGEYVDRITASFEQYPLQLAWAISMHKSQGQSFEFVHVDPSAIFAAGQLYVALSRARSLAGLSLQCPIRQGDRKGFFASKRVLAFVEKIEVECNQIKQTV